MKKIIDLRNWLYKEINLYIEFRIFQSIILYQ